MATKKVTTATTKDVTAKVTDVIPGVPFIL